MTNCNSFSISVSLSSLPNVSVESLGVVCDDDVDGSSMYFSMFCLE